VSERNGKLHPETADAYAERLERRIAELEAANAALAAREGWYRDLIDNARDMIWTVDLSGATRSARSLPNSSCFVYPVIDSQAEFRNVTAPDNIESARDALTRKWKSAKSTSFEIQIRSKSGRAVDLEVNSAILERDRQPQGILAIARDISERKALEEQLRQASKLEAVGRLAGGVAHDFNNLLTIITGYSQLLLNRVDADQPMHSGLDQIRISAERAAVLTRQLLAFSRRQPMQPALLDLNVVVADMKKMLGRLIGENIELTLKLCPEPCRVQADAGQLDQVVMNLVLNARDAMPDGGTVTVATSTVELTSKTAGANRVGPYSIVSVSDTGAGMSSDMRSHLFEPFYTPRGDSSSGLALSAVYGIVEQHGGFLRVASGPAAGTRFDVCLPRLIDNGVLRSAPEAGCLGGGETILVVEDEPGVLKLIAETLRVYGYKVIEAPDSAKAMAMARSGTKIDLLLTDVVMPKVNGRSLAEEWVARHPGLRVLYMSGYSNNPTVGHMLNDLGENLLTKPFSGAKLALKIREVLERA
jgi:two-component system, cell cycle sensor histidine kinase and response regulator CckA